jgi:hypothetical protein
MKITYINGADVTMEQRAVIEKWARKTIEEALYGDVIITLSDYDLENMLVSIDLQETMLLKKR